MLIHDIENLLVDSSNKIIRLIVLKYINKDTWDGLLKVRVIEASGECWDSR